MEHSASCRMQRISFNFGFLLLLESGEGSKQVTMNYVNREMSYYSNAHHHFMSQHDGKKVTARNSISVTSYPYIWV